MRLDADRLYLRPLAAADVTDVEFGWLNDPDVTRFLDQRRDPLDALGLVRFIEAMNGRDDEHLFGVFLREDDHIIGAIKLGPVHPVHNFGDVGLVIGARDARGQGYGAEAIERLSRHAFETLRLAKLSASLHAANVAGVQSFLKAGFEREGLRRGHYDLEGGRSDIVDLGLLSLRRRRRWRLG